MIGLQIVGGGRMGEALVRGLVAAGTDVATIAVVEKDASRREQLAAAIEGLEVRSEVGACVAAVVAVKPADVDTACRSLVAAGTPSRVLSIAAGVPTAAMEEAMGPSVAVVRAMPNTPAQIGAGASAIAAGATATDDDLRWAEGILGSVGTVVRVGEHLLNAVTGLSGSGPAYVFLVAEALTDAGVLNGLPRDIASSLAAQTLLGAARLLTESGQTPEELRAAVTSPGGTTAAGLKVLEERAVRAAFLEAVTAAANRFA